MSESTGSYNNDNESNNQVNNDNGINNHGSNQQGNKSSASFLSASFVLILINFFAFIVYVKIEKLV